MDTLHDILQRILPPKRLPVEKIQAVWKDIVGEVFSQETMPVYLVKGRLTVHCTSSSVVQEMVLRRKEILLGIGKRVPDVKVTAISFRQG